jgi:hypothetical protein
MPSPRVSTIVVAVEAKPHAGAHERDANVQANRVAVDASRCIRRPRRPPPLPSSSVAAGNH